jgi:hypothetical protein
MQMASNVGIVVCSMAAHRFILTPKGPRPFSGPFLKLGQAIMDAIFVQKISNFW